MEHKDLYQSHVDQFRDLVQETPEEAYHDYGVTVLNSLPPAEYFEERARFGWKPSRALDFFNLGVAASQKAEHRKAEGLYRKAIDLDEACSPAWYNLAYTCGELGQKKEQKEALKQFLEIMRNKEKTGRLTDQDRLDVAEAESALNELT